MTSGELQLLDAWWRAANYLSVGQIYLLGNPLLREPLQAEHGTAGRASSPTPTSRAPTASSTRTCRATELIEPLGLSQPTVSYHLKKLVDAGLLEREQRGKWAYFSLNPDAVAKLATVADLKGACC